MTTLDKEIQQNKKSSMKQNCTPNQLIKFLYRETTVSETLALHEALNEDMRLLEEYKGLEQAYRQLPKVSFRPSSSAIQNILAYSEHNAVENQA